MNLTYVQIKQSEETGGRAGKTNIPGWVNLIKGTAYKNTKNLEFSYRKFRKHANSKKWDDFSANSLSDLLALNQCPQKKKDLCFLWDQDSSGEKLPNAQAEVGGNQHRAAEKIQVLGIQLRIQKRAWHFKPA